MNLKCILAIFHFYVIEYKILYTWKVKNLKYHHLPAKFAHNPDSNPAQIKNLKIGLDVSF